MSACVRATRLALLAGRPCTARGGGRTARTARTILACTMLSVLPLKTCACLIVSYMTGYCGDGFQSGPRTVSAMYNLRREQQPEMHTGWWWITTLPLGEGAGPARLGLAAGSHLARGIARASEKSTAHLRARDMAVMHM